MKVDECLEFLDLRFKLNTNGARIKRPIWRDEKDIKGGEIESEAEQDSIGRTLKFPLPVDLPKYSDSITYQNDDLFLASGHVVIAMPADMNPRSAMASTIVREYGKEELFKMRPQVGQVLSINRGDQSFIHLMCTRASCRNPIVTEDLHSCLIRLAERYNFGEQVELDFPIVDPERGAMTLKIWYELLDRLYRDTAVRVVLHDRVYVTIGCYKIRR